MIIYCDGLIYDVSVSLGGADDEPLNKNILEFNQETESWTVIGTMREPRRIHAVSVVSFDDFKKWCN